MNISSSSRRIIAARNHSDKKSSSNQLSPLSDDNTRRKLPTKKLLVLPPINNTGEVLRKHEEMVKKSNMLQSIAHYSDFVSDHMDASHAKENLEKFSKEHGMTPSTRYGKPKGGKSKSKKNNKKTRRMRKNHSIKHRK